jgi:NAD(P) transhydrogenase subunit alpha
MIVGSPKEIFKGEARVAMTPESAKQIQKLGYTCIIETGAGLSSNFSDKDYRDVV